MLHLKNLVVKNSDFHVISSNPHKLKKNTFPLNVVFQWPNLFPFEFVLILSQQNSGKIWFFFFLNFLCKWSPADNFTVRYFHPLTVCSSRFRGFPSFTPSPSRVRCCSNVEAPPTQPAGGERRQRKRERWREGDVSKRPRSARVCRTAEGRSAAN